MSKRLYAGIYKRAGGAEGLPWHRLEPPEFLVRAVEARGTAGRALDVGCGAGVFSVWLARQGFEITGIDFTPAALELARARADEAGVDVTFAEVNVTSPWAAEAPFDLILDSGCLHSFGDTDSRAAYRANLLSWLAPGGDYVLGHFLKRHALDWRPVGPRRFKPETVKALFAPELECREQRFSDRTAPLPIGPSIRLGEFWFHRR